MARKYDPGACKDVAETMHEYKHDHKSRTQATAVGLSKARKEGKRVLEK